MCACLTNLMLMCVCVSVCQCVCVCMCVSNALPPFIHILSFRVSLFSLSESAENKKFSTAAIASYSYY